MRLLRKMRRRKAVYWEKTGRDGFNEPIFALPVEIKCRWDDEIVEGLDAGGKQTFFDTTVYVDRPMTLDGMLMKGKLKDLEGPLPPPKASRRIRKYEEIAVLRESGEPTIDSDKFMMVAYL